MRPLRTWAHSLLCEENRLSIFVDILHQTLHTVWYFLNHVPTGRPIDRPRPTIQQALNMIKIYEFIYIASSNPYCSATRPFSTQPECKFQTSTKILPNQIEIVFCHSSWQRHSQWLRIVYSISHFVGPPGRYGTVNNTCRQRKTISSLLLFTW